MGDDACQVSKDQGSWWPRWQCSLNIGLGVDFILFLWILIEFMCLIGKALSLD